MKHQRNVFFVIFLVLCIVLMCYFPSETMIRIIGVFYQFIAVSSVLFIYFQTIKRINSLNNTINNILEQEQLLLKGIKFEAKKVDFDPDIRYRLGIHTKEIGFSQQRIEGYIKMLVKKCNELIEITEILEETNDILQVNLQKNSDQFKKLIQEKLKLLTKSDIENKKHQSDTVILYLTMFIGILLCNFSNEIYSFIH